MYSLFNKSASWMLFIFLVTAATAGFAQSGTETKLKRVLDGGLQQLAPDSSITVQDSVYFNPAMQDKLDTPYKVRNIITFYINEYSPRALPASFDATANIRIIYTRPDLVVDSVDRSLGLHYDSSKPYTARNGLLFSNAHKVTVKVLSLVTESATDITAVLMLSNEMEVSPAYKWSCTENAVQNISFVVPAGPAADELTVNWPAMTGADQYDLEWAYVDSSALANHKYGNPVDPNLVFRNNATRVTITPNTYNIPLIFDNTGTLFFRVRAIQVTQGYSRAETAWSSDFAGGMGSFDFGGHQRNLNWQSSITFAEDGKRKVAVKYFDGSLRDRQVVTKDNITGQTVIGESFYDYQGRPVVQVLPAPSLNSIIQYSPGFNVAQNNAEYDKDQYDYLASPEDFLTEKAKPMSAASGAAAYYSPNNPEANSGVGRFIPNAHGYAFTETEYTQDNTGRISRRGGLGPVYQLGGNHETKYFYGSPTQDELDAIFGTEAGFDHHYFKNMVRDANGQLSVVYMDLQGRTVATALAGRADSADLDALPSDVPIAAVDTLSRLGSNVMKELSLESRQTKIVSVDGDYRFKYSLVPPVLQRKDCDSNMHCYTGFYDLEITITDDAYNQRIGGEPFTVFRSFTPETVTTDCSTPQPFEVDFTINLPKGSYEITKKLTLNKKGLDYYRDSIAANNLVCTTQEEFIQQQRELAVSMACVPTCETCRDSLGTWPVFRDKFMSQAGIPPQDSAAYRGEALAAYEAGEEACKSLCNGVTEADEIRAAMLLDMTPPSGQYANPENVGDVYSIFYVKNAYTLPAYQRDTVQYLDATGNPDKAFDEESETFLPVGKLKQEQFIKKFSDTWAEALLKFHPEYCKLLEYERYRASDLWDRVFESTDTYAEAKTKGYLNPTANSAYIFPVVPANQDPLSLVSPALKASLENALTNYNQQGGENILSLWSVATAAVKCSGNNNVCIALYNTPAKAFDETTMCQGDLDMAWRNFRQLYLVVKRNIITTQLNNAKCDVQPPPTAIQLSNAGKQPHFNNAIDALSQNGLGYITNTGDAMGARDSANTRLDKFYEDNCRAYAKMWVKQLAPCQYSQSALDNDIIPKLVAVCREGSDRDNQYGSSTVRPASNYHYRSFQQVLDEYNAQHGINDPLNCNSQLITAPRPYGKQPAYYDKPSYTKPEECECTNLNRLKKEYDLRKSSADADFSGYIFRTRGVSVSQTDLNQLLDACSGNNLCTYFSRPVVIPALILCNTAPACVPCRVTDSLYAEFAATYPGITPAITESDSLQMKKNDLFASFMNNRLGYQKQAWEYLAFRDSCQGTPYTDSTVCEPAVKSFGSRRYNNNGTDYISHTIRTEDTSGTGYLLAGHTTGSGEGGRDAYIIRTDLAGNIIWAKTYGGTQDDEFTKIRPAEGGGFIAIGTTRSFNNDNGEVFLVRINASGNVQWSKTIGFSTPNGEFGTDIIKLSTGGYAFGGRYNSVPTQGDLLVGMIDDEGNVSWIKQVGSGNSDDGLSLLEDADTLVIGAESFFNTLYDGVIMKLNKSTGATISVDQYDFSGKALWVGEMKKKTTGGYEILFLNTNNFQAQNGIGGLMDISQDGDLSGMRLFSQPGGNSVGGVAHDAALNDAYTMALTTSQNGVNDIFLQRYYPDGSMASSNKVDLKGTETITSVLYNPDGTLAVAGVLNGNAMLFVADTSGQTGCADSAMQASISSGGLTITKNISYKNIDRDTAHSNIELQAVNAFPETLLLGCTGGDTCYVITSGPLLCGNASPLFPSAMTGIEEINNCSDTAFYAVSTGTELYKVYRDTVLRNFSSDYIKASMGPGLQETFTVEYSTSEYHYTLYYYNQAGNLVKTVPPAGVVVDRSPSWLAAVKIARLKGESLVPAHRMQTQYRYNTLGQVLEQYSPDAGITRFYYDVIGRLVLSQNAKQAEANLYGYTSYDSLGRITEVGELSSTAPMTLATAIIPASLKTWLNDAASSRTQITRTIYDRAYAPLEPVMSAANLRNRVAWTAVYNTASDLDSNKYTNATFYSYDIHGNVDTLVQDFKAGSMAAASNRFKKIVYQYDLISGKVLQVAYQPGQADAFYHRYAYDAENRLTDAETSRDSIYWEHDAFYQYYRHGTLARMILGQQQVQGLDYVYNIQGWLKSLNSAALQPSFDPGNDGGTGNIAARDALGYNLHYFGDRDYEPINNQVKPVADGVALSADFRPLFNGNIAAMSVNIPAAGDAMLYTYRYDVLSRLTRMQAHNNLQPTTNTWAPITLPDFGESVSYDPNGNILTYKRAGNNTFAGKPLAMDDLTYSYKYGMNQLRMISDTVSAGNYAEDIDNQEQDNYVYDTIGNLIKDVAGKLTNIEWNVYGKIRRITKEDGSTIQYYYDAGGNRIGKESEGKFTWYVRGAGGNVMSVYSNGIDTVNSGMLTQMEAHLYGSSRLGIYNFRTNVQQPSLPEEVNLPGLGTASEFGFVRGNKYFELSNHLGNVLTTVSDKKKGVSLDGTTIDHYLADVVSAQDYYPFGMGMPGRRFNSGVYRYGFNGKENDNEVKGEGNQQDYGMRIYDPRIGKFLSVDPLTKSYPELTPYQFASNSPISGVDLDGKEYLHFSEALVQFKNGALELKLENMYTITQNLINSHINDPRNWPYDEHGVKMQGKSLAVATFSMETPNPSKGVDGVNTSDKDEDPNYDPTRLPMGGTTWYTAKRNGLPQEINTGGGPARPAAAKAALVINLLNFGMETIGGYMVNSDINDARDQAKKYALMVTEDINTAMGQGLIPEKYQDHASLINIGNVIFQGVNNTKDENIYNIGMKIFNEISLKRFAQTGTIKSTLDNIPSRQIEIPRIDDSKDKKN